MAMKGKTSRKGGFKGDGGKCHENCQQLVQDNWPDNGEELGDL